ncbi:hypothetical protein EV121DRAFT_297275 [Schizophyllum commune]
MLVRNLAPNQYAYEPTEERQREPRPSTQVVGQDVLVCAMTSSAPPPSQIRTSRSAPPVPTSYPLTVPSSYSLPISPHPYAYGSTREEEGNEDEFTGNQSIPSFHLLSHRLKTSISVPNSFASPLPHPRSLRLLCPSGSRRKDTTSGSQQRQFSKKAVSSRAITPRDQVPLQQACKDLSRSHAKNLTKGGAANAKAKLKKPEPPAQFDFGLGTVKPEGHS